MPRLRSRSELRVVDLICEGEIEGFAPEDINDTGTYNTGTFPYKSCFFNEMPIISENGLINYPVSGIYGLAFTRGTPYQQPVSGFQNLELSLPLPINTEIRKEENGSLKDVTINFSTKDYPLASYIVVNFRTPALFSVDDNGDLKDESIGYTIYTAVNDYANWLGHGGRQIIGNSTSEYYWTNQISLTDLDAFATKDNNIYKIKIRRDSVNTNEVNRQNQIFIDSINVGCKLKLNYPHTSLATWVLNSEQFGSTPGRMYRIKGLKIKIPSNYDPLTRTYNGIWDGTFSETKQWTSNPAWIFYDLITNSRYGLGNHIKEEWIDKWTLYELGQYCDEMVDDGEGGEEPRFQCNVVINSEQDAYQLLQNIASSFRGMMYWANGQIFITQDGSSEPLYNFTNANVVDGLFNYSSSAQKVRHTVASVRWLDWKNQFRETTEIIEDSEGILKYGYNETEIIAFGCITRGQAIRVGQWLLTSERLLTETVSFKAGIEGYYLRPGDTINIYDNLRYNKKQGGRIVGINSLRNHITIDKEVDLLSGWNYNLIVVTPSGSLNVTEITGSSDTAKLRQSQLTTITVTGEPEYGTNLIKVSGSYPSSIYTGAIWILDAYNDSYSALNHPSLYKVISIRETEKNIVEVSALDYSTGKFTFIETGYSTIEKPTGINLLPSPLPAPSGLNLFIEYDTVRERVLLNAGWSGIINNNLQSYIVSGYPVSIGVSGTTGYTGSYRNLGSYIQSNAVVRDLTNAVTGYGVYINNLTYSVSVFSNDVYGQLSTTPLSGSINIPIHIKSNDYVEVDNDNSRIIESTISGKVYTTKKNQTPYYFTGRNFNLIWGSNENKLTAVTGWQLNFYAAREWPVILPNIWDNLLYSENIIKGNNFVKSGDINYYKITGDFINQNVSGLRQFNVEIKDLLYENNTGQNVSQVIYNQEFNDKIDSVSGYDLTLSSLGNTVYYKLTYKTGQKETFSDFSGIYFWFTGYGQITNLLNALSTGQTNKYPDYKSNLTEGFVNIDLKGNKTGYIVPEVIDTFGQSYDYYIYAGESQKANPLGIHYWTITETGLKKPTAAGPTSVNGDLYNTEFKYVPWETFETLQNYVYNISGGTGVSQSYVDSNFVTISGNNDITGLKKFVGAVQIESGIFFGNYATGSSENTDAFKIYRISGNYDYSDLRIVIGDNYLPGAGSPDRLIIGAEDSAAGWEFKEHFIFESTGRLYIPSGYVQDNRMLDYINLPFYINAPFVENRIIEAIVANQFTITGFMVSCINTGNSILNGSFYRCDLDNNNFTTFINFGMDANTYFIISGISETGISSRSKLGVSLASAPTNLSGLSLGLYGYKVI